MRSIDVDGRLHVECTNISKAVVNPYYGREIPDSEAMRLEPDKIYFLYRHPDELKAAADSFRNLPLLLAHVPVNAEQPAKELWVGCTGSDVEFKKPYLKCSLAVWTNEAIALIDAKEQDELSSSYRYRADMTPGKTPDGVSYDGVMRDIVGNHVALVTEGRAGPDVVVADQNPLEFSKMKFLKHATALAAIKPFLAADANVEALDEELDKIKDKADDEDMDDDAFDAACEGMSEAEKKKATDKRAKDKKARDKAAKDKAAKDAESNADDADPEAPEGGAKKPAADSQVITRADLDAATAKAAADAVTRVNALHAAKEDVAPLVGVVAADSAEGVYKFALDKLGVDTKGVHPSAFRALVLQAQKFSTRRPAREAELANDAVAVSAVAMFPNVQRIRRA